MKKRNIRLLSLDAAAHVETEDVVRAFPERVDLRVAKDARHRPVLDIAVAAVHFDRVAGRGDADARCPQLDQWCTDPEAMSRLEAVEDECLCGLDVDHELCELALHQRLLGQRLAECLSRPCVAQRLDERATSAS